MNAAENENPNEPILQDLPAIESIEDYIRRYGLPTANQDSSSSSGEFNGLNRLEAIERIRAEDAYRYVNAWRCL